MRMETKWDQVLTTEYLDPDLLANGTDRVILRKNSDDPKVFQCALFSPENWIQKFFQLRIMLKGKCVSVKLFFPDTAPYPADLEKLGFERSFNSWKYEHPDYSAEVDLQPHYSEDQWVLKVYSKKFAGIPANALNIFQCLFSKVAAS